MKNFLRRNKGVQKIKEAWDENPMAVVAVTAGAEMDIWRHSDKLDKVLWIIMALCMLGSIIGVVILTILALS